MAFISVFHELFDAHLARWLSNVIIEMRVWRWWLHENRKSPFLFFEKLVIDQLTYKFVHMPITKLHWRRECRWPRRNFNEFSKNRFSAIFSTTKLLERKCWRICTFYHWNFVCGKIFSSDTKGKFNTEVPFSVDQTTSALRLFFASSDRKFIDRKKKERKKG